ncbi:MAG: hypothetical protein ACW9XA_06790 [Candidatus Nitrosopumilus sp. bin_6a]
MSKNKDSVFEEYEDLYKLTAKTADDHIEFYKKKEAIPEETLFDIWKKLSQQSENFDKRDWTENWHNWHKNLQGFERHQFEARFLIQHYLTDVLEELIDRLVQRFEKSIRLSERITEPSPKTELSELIKKEVKRQVKQELSKQKIKKK